MTENLHNHFTSQFVGLHSAAVKSTTLNQSQVAGENLNHKSFKELISLIVTAIHLGDMTGD